MTRQRISVVIPCYNAERFLDESLRSVLAQTHPVDEIIVVDDGSTDASAAIARGLGATCITLEHNVGPGAARNRGISAATGDLIAFLDADDYWTETHLADLSSLLEQYPESPVAFSRIQRFGEDDSISPASLPEGPPVSLFWQLIDENIVAQSTTVVRRETLMLHGCYDAARRYSEDYELWLRLARHYPFVCTNAITAGYRVHPQQASSNVVHMLSGGWHVKHALWQQAIGAEPPAFVDELERRILRAWDATLEKAWWDRDRIQFRTALELHSLVPRSEASYRRWALRYRSSWRAWLIVTGVWERLPESARALARPALTAVFGPRRQSAPLPH
ncbi:MAG: glycosyltransferase family 2 protein [Gemmatimonadaceae bacterium]|nr:glycosyltransferase family 2 protein [Gemmatimonadaceae bacterium]